jgi:hypothetical protein
LVEGVDLIQADGVILLGGESAEVGVGREGKCGDAVGLPNLGVAYLFFHDMISNAIAM